MKTITWQIKVLSDMWLWRVFFLVLLCLVVIHILVHGAVLQVKPAFVFVDKVQLVLQASDVGLQHGFHLRRSSRLLLQQFPLCLQHFVLLLQISHLGYKQNKASDELTGLWFLFF